ncbi:head decoration protein [Pseudaminobacter arsenicus]|uniref:Head decoration protein n=1 Tax=Borborobacter arsenicus TaxID=1851146 RepID=A0A432V155_9HYPH|nr:head decoration protein [Pseudaminobacter arsenicus]RUM95927.1 head decoration protein [Pseudaminobacter arsenicus]
MMQTEGRHPGEFVMREANGQRSRESLTIAAEQIIEANSVVCRTADPAKVSATASVGAENAGDATIAVGSPGASTAVSPGRYRGVATDATHVTWEDPAGHYIGESVHGTPFPGEISLTITAGTTPTAAGDEFYVVVTGDADAWQHVSFDADAGLPIAGLAIYPATTGVGETVKIAAIVRDAEANANCVAWPASITDAEKTIAKGALARLGIIVRC